MTLVDVPSDVLLCTESEWDLPEFFCFVSDSPVCLLQLLPSVLLLEVLLEPLLEVSFVVLLLVPFEMLLFFAVEVELPSVVPSVFVMELLLPLLLPSCKLTLT